MSLSIFADWMDAFLHGRQVGPAPGEVDGGGGVNDTEAVLVVEVVAIGVGAVGGCAVLPAWVGGVVPAGGPGEDELEVAPGEVRVGLADEGGYAGDGGGRDEVPPKEYEYRSEFSVVTMPR